MWGINKLVFACSTVLALAACGKGGGGGDVADRAVTAADAICGCKDFDCTKPHMQDLNKMAIKEEDAVKALSAERAKVYSEAQSRAAECQIKLRGN